MATKNGKKGSQRQNLLKQKKSRNERNIKSSASPNSATNRSPKGTPKYKSGSHGSSSVGYGDVSARSAMPLSAKGSGPGLRFQDQPLKRRGKGSKSSNLTDDGASSSESAHRPTFQFKIGMQVGVALGDCFLQLQKLENSMDHLRNVSEDITDVMQCIEQMQPSRRARKGSHSENGAAASSSDQLEQHLPLEDVAVLNENLARWRMNSTKRMKTVSATVDNLQCKLEDLDEMHSVARQSTASAEIDAQNERIRALEKELEAARKEADVRNLQIQQMKRSAAEPGDLVRDKLIALETKEKELDRDAEMIATQSEELRKESVRLLTEREEVRKQKEQWQNMIDEVKDQKAKIEKRESELQTNHKKLLELHETLSEEKKKLHKKAKKIKAREKRLNALRAAQSESAYVRPQSNFNHMVPSSNGSDYAESELTYFSDGDTEIASVNSISDDESEQNSNYRQKQQIKALSHLGVPTQTMF